jgi:hypothetical protein
MTLNTKRITLLLAVAATCAMIWLLNNRTELFMKENEVLSASFSKSYDGPSFNVLRAHCWAERSIRPGSRYVKWEIFFQQGGVQLEIEGGARDGYPCLGEPDDKPSLVIKSNDSGNSGYSVMTTGEELAQPFSLDLVKQLIQVVETGSTNAQHQSLIENSWKLHKN